MTLRSSSGRIKSIGGGRHAEYRNKNTEPAFRRLGNLPESTKDELLEPHISGAEHKVKGYLGGKWPTKQADVERVQEAIGCLALSFALPVLNTFYLSEADKVPRKVAQTDYVFHDPGEVVKLAVHWRNRAYEALKEIGRTGGAATVAVI